MSGGATLSLPLLDRVRIAAPCTVRWEDMHGDDRLRRCDQCSLNVHNLSAMTSAEVEAFLAPYATPDADGNTPRLCGHIFKRRDGTILTADCPVGLAAVRARAHRAVARVATAVGLTTLVAWAAARESQAIPFSKVQPLGSIATWLRGAPTLPTPRVYGFDGEVSFVPAAAPAPPSGGVKQ
jgi:hypothetical protein